jgi:hypothetical protein
MYYLISHVANKLVLLLMSLLFDYVTNEVLIVKLLISLVDLIT